MLDRWLAISTSNTMELLFHRSSQGNQIGGQHNWEGGGRDTTFLRVPKIKNCKDVVWIFSSGRYIVFVKIISYPHHLAIQWESARMHLSSNSCQGTRMIKLIPCNIEEKTSAYYLYHWSLIKPISCNLEETNYQIILLS